MRRVFLTALAATVLTTAAPALADSAPTLHGFCSMGSVCTDNGVNTPTSTNPPTFGFSASPGPATGDFLLAVLVPNNVAYPSNFTVSGYLTGTLSLVSTTAWTTGDLSTYLGLTASPPNPIGAYLPATQTYDAGATGYYVFTYDFGTTTLPANNGISDSYLSTLGQTVVAGTYLTGFLTVQGDTGSTAQSGAILEIPRGVPEPATWALMLLGFGGIGMAMRRSRKSKPALMQVA
jgi:PEP-CTERM motif